MEKKRAEVEIEDLPDLSNFTPDKNKKPPVNKKLVEQSAKASGFNTRHANQSVETKETTFDARSLRRTHRTAKLNIAVKPETRDRFWVLVQSMDLTSGEEGLINLMDVFEKSQSQ